MEQAVRLWGRDGRWSDVTRGLYSGPGDRTVYMYWKSFSDGERIGVTGVITDRGSSYSNISSTLYGAVKYN